MVDYPKLYHMFWYPLSTNGYTGFLILLTKQNSITCNVMVASCDLFNKSINIYHGKFTSGLYLQHSLNAVSRVKKSLTTRTTAPSNRT